MCAAFLQSSANPYTHIYSLEIVNKKKVELENMCNCIIPLKCFSSPMKHDFLKNMKRVKYVFACHFFHYYHLRSGLKYYSVVS